MGYVKSFLIGAGIVFVANKGAEWLKTPDKDGKLLVENKTVQEYALPIAGGVAFVVAKKLLGAAA